VTRIGGTKPVSLDVRVIATTNQNLSELIKEGRFRNDLFYRFNVIPINIPPLRERKEDIPLLMNLFLNQYNAKYKQKKVIGPGALDAFQAYHYPGNVRELRNIMERLVVTGNERELTAQAFLDVIGQSGAETIHLEHLDKVSIKEAVKRLEKQIIERALKQHGSTHKAAKALGISQPTVLRKARSLGIRIN
jgi:transcriptional regulator with PAS, ATPase and Fis domain